jgi:hypothetical protein
VSPQAGGGGYNPVMSPANIFIIVLFSLVGLAAFRYGRKTSEARPMLLGAALMVYGYFVSSAWLSLLVGGVLTVLIFFPD